MEKKIGTDYEWIGHMSLWFMNKGSVYPLTVTKLSKKKNNSRHTEGYITEGHNPTFHCRKNLRSQNWW